MRDQAVVRKDGTHYYLSGREVTKEKYEEYYPPMKMDGGFPAMNGWSKPMLSDAMAVHPEQIEEARERDKKHGVPTDYTADGRPILHSEDHKRRLMKSLGYHDRNSYV